MTTLFDNFKIPPMGGTNTPDPLLRRRQAIARGYTSPKRIKLIDFDKENQQYVIRDPMQRVGVWRPRLAAKRGQSGSVRLAASQAPELKRLLIKSAKLQPTVNQKLMNKPCPPGKVRNPATGRCIAIANLAQRSRKARSKGASDFASLIKQIKQMDLGASK
jgi:hypothetical protein